MGLSRALGSPNGAMQGAQFCGWKLHTRRSCDGKRRRQREVLQGRLMEFNRFSHGFTTVGCFRRRGWNGITISRDC